MTGEEWVEAYCEKQGLVWGDLTIPEQRGILQSIPCTVRCWRVGEPVDGKPGDPCDECGRPHPLPNLWQKVLHSD